jgi:hypothetical protein
VLLVRSFIRDTHYTKRPLALEDGWTSTMTLSSLVSGFRQSLIRLDRLTGLAFIVAHLEPAAVQNLMSNIQFYNNKKRVHMSLGSSYPSLSLEVCEFRTAIEKLSHVPDLASKTNDHLMTFTSIATLQYGVPNAALGHLKQTCMNYIEVISNCTNISMGSSRITRETFDAIRRFQQASPPARQVCIGFPHRD